VGDFEMTEEKLRSWLSVMLMLGIFLALLVVLTGALLYLLKEGQNPIAYQNVTKPASTYTAILPVIKGSLSFDPFALVLLGFLILVVFQLLRVLILGCFFLKTAEYLLAFSSFFIFSILTYSLLWPG
jgi:uncharacterized membrane protein